MTEIGGGAEVPYADLNTKVFDWFCSARARNIPLTGRLLQAKASEVVPHLQRPPAL